MSTQTVTGVLRTNKGTIPLEATLTDGTEGNLTTDATYTVTAQEIGVYGAGQTVQGGFIQSATGLAFGYVLRNGQVASAINGLGSLALGGAPAGIVSCKPVTFDPWRHSESFDFRLKEMMRDDYNLCKPIPSSRWTRLLVHR